MSAYVYHVTRVIFSPRNGRLAFPVGLFSTSELAAEVVAIERECFATKRKQEALRTVAGEGATVDWHITPLTIQHHLPAEHRLWSAAQQEES